jgi:membrane protein
MTPTTRSARAFIAQPGTFAWGVLKAFGANQGLLLAGAVAYYTLLSLAPLLILIVIVLSHFVDEAQLLLTLAEYLEFVVPGQSSALITELRTFLANRAVIGGVLLVTMIFFSALAFGVLQNAMSVIFFHRVAVRRRHWITSLVMPYLFVIFLTLGLLLVTFVSGLLQTLGTREVQIFGVLHSLDWLSTTLLYLLGVAGEILLLTAIYLVMPVGRLSWQRALIGGVTAGLLWEVTRHILAWYYSAMAQITTLYGSLSTAIAVLLSVEIAAIVILLGGQVIAEYERIGTEPVDVVPEPMQTAGPSHAPLSPSLRRRNAP